MYGEGWAIAMDDDGPERSLSERVRVLEEEQSRAKARLADVARLAEIVMQAPGDPRAAPGRHRAQRQHRERPDWLRVIPGGLAALVPMPGHGAAGFLPAAGQVWLGRRAWPRWAMAALAFGLAGATAMPTAADTVHPHATVIRVHRHRGGAEEDEGAALANLLCGRELTAARAGRPRC